MPRIRIAYGDPARYEFCAPPRVRNGANHHMAQLPSHRSSPQQWRAAALLPQLALLLASATAAVELTWHGPTADIWTDSQCALLGSACKGTGHTVRDCEAACSKTKGCTAVAFNTGSGTGDRCQLRGCNTSHPAPVPRWSVPQWRGFATFPVPVAPPTPPAPPAPPQVPLILLEKQLKETGARCLDGTPQGMYFEPGVGEDAKNWVVALDGGGWCYNLAPSEQDPFSEPGPGGTEWGNADSCWGRSHSSLGSTLPQYHPRSIAGGYLAGTPMANWSRAQVLYCDGGSFSGNRDEPVTVSGTGTPGAEVNRTLYFRGQRNLDAVIDELRSRGMGTAAGGGEGGMAVLSGCSAGGLGALVQCDHFASQLPAGMKPRCIGDAGVFMDATSLTTFDGGKSLMQMQFGNVVTMQNASLSPHCLASKQNTFPAACFFPQNTLPTQQTPTFVRNSFYNYVRRSHKRIIPFQLLSKENDVADSPCACMMHDA